MSLFFPPRKYACVTFPCVRVCLPCVRACVRVCVGACVGAWLRALVRARDPMPAHTHAPASPQMTYF